MRKLIFLLLISLLAVPAQAADNWYVFLFNGITRQLVRFNGLDSSQITFDLGLNENAYISGQDIAFTPDGNVAIFCAPNTPVAQASTLIVRDLAAQQNRFELPMGGSIGCRVTPEALDSAQNRVAVGVVNYFPGDANADLSRPVWRLVVVDLASGSITAELNSQSPQAANLLLGTAIMPEVRYFAHNELIFAETVWATGGAPEWRAFRWNLGGQTLEADATGHWGKTGLVFRPETGELVWLDNNPNLPAVDAGGPFPAFNTVQLRDNSGQARTIFHTGEWLLLDSVFIDGGTRLAVLGISAFDTEDPTSTWLALGRDGSSGTLADGGLFSQIAGTPGGYVLFTMTANADFTQQTFTLDYTSNGATQRLWESNEPGWELSGTLGDAPASGLAAFPAQTP
jgi:hypothetical protein